MPIINEPNELAKARSELGKYENAEMTEDGLFHLSEGLSILAEFIEKIPDGKWKTIAHTLAKTYTSKSCKLIAEHLHDPSLITEPSLQHCVRVLSELEIFEFGNKKEISSLKVAAIKIQFDEFIFKGYTKEEKARVIEELSKTKI